MSAGLKRWKPYPEYKESGVEWLGKVPAGWELFSLRRLFCVKSGDMTTSEDLLDDGFQVFGGNGFRGYFDRWNTGKGVIIIGRYGALCGNIKISPDKIWATEHAFRVFPFMNFDIHFMAFFLEHLNLNRLSARAAQPGLNSEMVRDHFIASPPLHEQQAIAAFLDQQCAQIDSLIEKKQRMLDLLDEKRRAVITQAVTRGLDPSVPMKDSGVEWLGMVPEGWKILALKRAWEKCEYGISDSLQGDGRVRVLTMGHIQEGSVILPVQGCIDDVPEKLILQDGDLLYNRTNSLEHVGKVGLFYSDNGGPVSFASYLVRIVPSVYSCGKYLNYLLNSQNLREIAKRMALPSINQANLTTSRYGVISLAFPPLHEQQAIADYLDAQCAAMDSQRKSLEKSIELLREYRSSLITHAVTGKIDVRELAPLQ